MNGRGVSSVAATFGGIKSRPGNNVVLPLLSEKSLKSPTLAAMTVDETANAAIMVSHDKSLRIRTPASDSLS